MGNPNWSVLVGIQHSGWQVYVGTQAPYKLYHETIVYYVDIKNMHAYWTNRSSKKAMFKVKLTPNHHMYKEVNGIREIMGI